MHPDRLVVPGLATPPGYAHAIVARLDAGAVLVRTAGAVPLDAEGALVGAGDVVAQTRQVVRNLHAALAAAGAAPEDVVEATIHVASSDRAELVAAWQAFADASPVHRSACTLVGVALLGYSGQLVEIGATAIVR